MTLSRSYIGYQLTMVLLQWTGTPGNEVTMPYLADIDVRLVSPDSADGRLVLSAYFREILSRYDGHEPTQAEVDAMNAAEPGEDWCPPRGLFFVARDDSAVVGCAGLRLVAEGVGDVRRMFVVPRARRRGVGQQLLDAVEDAARVYKVTLLRLDTGSHMTEAVRLYIRNGYRQVPPFNDFHMADLWYEKSIA